MVSDMEAKRRVCCYKKMSNTVTVTEITNENEPCVRCGAGHVKRCERSASTLTAERVRFVAYGTSMG